MTFRIKSSSGASPENPEILLRDLRRRKIPDLLSHQADVIRSYLSIHEDHSDIALQLPTGSGKTLVGLLIAEWRRRKYGERAVYLCPTKQLVHQVAGHANNKYGLDVHAFVGKKADYDNQACADWQAGDAIAITNYSSLFNVRPFFEDAQLIILDDAHSAENYISSCWSLTIERYNSEHANTYNALATVLAPHLQAADRSRIIDKDKDKDKDNDARWVDLIPGPVFTALVPELIPLLDAYTNGSRLRYAWSMLKDSLESCLCYVSSRAILIRPLVPPASLHEPFNGATQRIYMSATLGEGGDLERITGRHPIHRVPVPSGWDKQGIGRRFFLFPQRSLEEQDATSMAADAIKKYGRALYLVPDDRRAELVRKWVAEDLECATFDAKQIEESKDAFIKSDEAVAVVANRYDGIDLVDDECRLILAEGLPRGANLQERFLVSRIGANLLLDDRILTRVVQGFGRCTRSPNDYAAILIYGDDLQQYLLAAERRKFFHPEIQAELAFGLEQSRDTTAAEMLELLEHFKEQDGDWRWADDQIVSDRAALLKIKLPATDELASAVPHEIKYQYAAWQGDYVAALAECRAVLAILKHAELQGYRALWLYLAGNTAHLAEIKKQISGEGLSREYFIQAAKAARGLRWLISLHRASEGEAATHESDSGAEALVERLELSFDSLGMTHDSKYSSQEAEIRKTISQNDDGKLFEQGHTLLGCHLGYVADNVETDGSPDPWWYGDGSLCFVFEDYSEAGPDSVLSVTKARQAAGHASWVRDNISLEADAIIVPVLVTATKLTTKGALPHLKEVRYWDLDQFRTWANLALGVVRELRTKYPGEGNILWRAEAAEQLRKFNIAPLQLLELLTDKASDVMSVT